MASEVIVDFRGEVYAEALPIAEPTRGRIVANREELVAATADHELRVSLEDVFDVVEKQPVLDIEFIDTVLTIAYREDDERRTLLVGATPDEIAEVRYALFEAILTGPEFHAVHPERIGGRVMNRSSSPTRLDLSPERVRFRAIEDATIRLADVTGFERGNRRFGDAEDPWPAVRIRHSGDDESRTTVIGHERAQSLNLLGRYLQLEYTDLRDAVDDVDLSERELQALVTIYSGGGSASLAQSLGVDAATARAVIDRLDENGLVTDEGGAPSLTDRGRVIVNERLESVNA